MGGGEGGRARRKTTKGRTGFFYRASAFKMTALETEMTQIIGESVGVGEMTDIHSSAGWLWLGVGMGNLRREGALYMEREIKGNVL